MRRTAKLAILGASVAALAGVAAPAIAAGPVAVSLNAGGTRTLNLYQSDGKTQLQSLDLTSGAGNFIAQVVDSTYTNKGFKVQATMTNLYPFANNAYNCNGTPIVPSSAVTLSSPSGLLTLGGVSSALTPVFTVTGTLGGAVDPLLAASPVNINSLMNGQLPLPGTLSQTQLTGNPAANLVGNALATVESKLPVPFDTSSLGGPFTNPDVHPCDLNPGQAATQVQVMDGVSNPVGLLGDVLNQITSLPGVTGNPPTATLTQLINGGFLTPSQVSSVLQGVTSLVTALGGLTQLTNDLPAIENTLTAVLNTTNVSLLSGATSQSGTYSSSPGLAVNTSNISGLSGTYKGVMTVTLLDQ